MAEGMAIAGLASSIVSFLGVSYEVCKRAKEFSRTAGQLPTDVKSAKNLLDVITRSAERLPARLRTFAAGNPVFGPPTEQEVDLMGLFDKLTVLSTELLRIIDKLDNAHNVMSKALLSIPKEKKVENIPEELNRCILAINFLLSEGIHASVGEVSDIAAELRKQHLEFHQGLEQNMSAGFQALGNDVCNSHNKLLEEFRNLMANQEKVVAASHLDVILGQRDIAQNLDAIIRLIARAKSDIKEELAGDMERSLLKQRDITREMLKLTVKEVNSSMIIQTQALMHEMLESSTKHSNSRGLARVSGDALDNITKGKTNGIYLRVNFEFRFHSEVLVIHVTRCIEWAASRFALFSVPKFTFNFPYYKRKTGETELYLGPQCALYDKFEVNITYEYRIRGQYQRIRVILEKEKVKEDLATAAELSSRELDLFWPPLLPRPLRKLSYTKCYSSVNIKQSIHMERRDPPQTFRSKYAPLVSIYFFLADIVREWISGKLFVATPVQKLGLMDDSNLFKLLISRSKLLNNNRINTLKKPATKLVETVCLHHGVIRICDWILITIVPLLIVEYWCCTMKRLALYICGFPSVDISIQHLPRDWVLEPEHERPGFNILPRCDSGKITQWKRFGPESIIILER